MSTKVPINNSRCNCYYSEDDACEDKKIDISWDSRKMLPLSTADVAEVKPPSLTEQKTRSEIAYKLGDVPPWYLCIALGLQHYLTMFGGTVTYPYLIAPKLCIPERSPARGYLISTTFFVSGIATFLQTTFGVRLPIVQGSTVALLVPILAVLQLPQWQCPQFSELSSSNSSTPIDVDEEWMRRMREVQGAIIGASIFEVVIGFTGFMGILLQWITPLAIVPTVTLVGLSLFLEAADSAAGNWAVAFLTILLLVLFSQMLKDVTTPWPKYDKTIGWSVSRFPIFKLFPVLLTIAIAWVFCVVLTVTNVLPKGSLARTDLKINILKESPWFRFPYPAQWGLPTFSTAAVFGVLAGVIASAIESVGDYYACARLAGAPPPPKHAINRGIWAEGIGCILAGIWGTGGGVTSYSENIGAIGITKVASRRVIQYGSALMILFGMLGKAGALFVTIPEPVVGGVFCVMFSMITAVGLSTLHFVDLTSSRNLFVLGFSLFTGLAVPKWLQAHPDAIDAGDQVVTQIITVLLSTSMFVGGFVGFFLDNIIPGTDEERGILRWKESEIQQSGSPYTTTSRAYDIPLMMPAIKNLTLFQYLPVSPTFKEGAIKGKLIDLKNWCMSSKGTYKSGQVITNTETTHF